MPSKTTLSAMLSTGLFSLLVGVSINVHAQGAETPGLPKAAEVKAEAQANTRYLAAEALNKAKAILKAYGEFAPFGAGLFQDGEVNFVWAVKPGESTEAINSTLVLNAVRSALTTQARSGRILGSAVVYLYRGSAGDGGQQPQINVELEYLNGYAEVLATHYVHGEKGIEFTSSGHQPFQPKIFAGANHLKSSQ